MFLSHPARCHLSCPGGPACWLADYRLLLVRSLASPLFVGFGCNAPQRRPVGGGDSGLGLHFRSCILRCFMLLACQVLRPRDAFPSNLASDLPKMCLPLLTGTPLDGVSSSPCPARPTCAGVCRFCRRTSTLAGFLGLPSALALSVAGLMVRRLPLFIPFRGQLVQLCTFLSVSAASLSLFLNYNPIIAHIFHLVKYQFRSVFDFFWRPQPSQLPAALEVEVAEHRH